MVTGRNPVPISCTNQKNTMTLATSARIARKMSRLCLLSLPTFPRATIDRQKANTKALVETFRVQRPKVRLIRRGVIWPLASCTASSIAETA
jgi:hypothetical protein